MAGIGPPPKPAAQRRRRNKKPAVAVPASGVSTAVPPLPDGYAVTDGETFQQEFLPRTIAWYETVCASPEMQGLTPVNFLRLQDIATLQDRFFRTGSLEVQKELRVALAGFGATPMDARRVGVEIKRQAPSSEKPKAAAPAANVRRLRAVDPQAV